MFNLVGIFDNEEKVYKKGDIVLFSFKDEVKMSGIFEKVTDFGQVCLTNIHIIKGKKDIATDATMKLGVYEMGSFSKKIKGCFVLLEEEVVKYKLKSYRGKVEFCEGDKISVEVITDVGTTVCSGVYSGIKNSKICIKNCTINEKLLLLNKKPSKSLKEEILIDIENINFVWFSGNYSNRYKVKIESIANI